MPSRRSARKIEKAQEKEDRSESEEESEQNDTEDLKDIRGWIRRWIRRILPRRRRTLFDFWALERNEITIRGEQSARGYRLTRVKDQGVRFLLFH